MEDYIQVKPLPYKTRQRTFGMLFLVFALSIPFLYLYATGYRFDFAKPTNLVSTGGIYVAVERAGADIYIDNELVRETRTFRKAFYAQNLDAGTHRVHVQKDGYHTWVKELPVSKHLVTEAEAFNLPLVPQVRVISKFASATGTMIVKAPVTNASSTNEVLATTTRLTKGTFAFTENEEFKALITHFGTTSTSTSTKTETTAQQLTHLLQKNASSSPEEGETATTTVISNGVKLYENGDDIVATWVGSFEDMPYYYCAPDFPAYSTSSASTTKDEVEPLPEDSVVISAEEAATMHPVQSIPKDVVCDPTIRIDNKWQEVQDFDFYPGSTDLVILVLQDGVYVVEVDDRSWQNVQPLFMGNGLKMHIESGNIYVYDGELIYQVDIATE